MSRLLAVFVALLLIPALHASAQENGTKEEAVAMVKRVQARFRADGPDATFDAVTRRDRAFNDRDLYPFVYRLDGVNVAHGARPALVGKNLINIKDPDGILLIQRMVEIARHEGSGWVDYKWPNPVTNVIEDKSSYIEKMDDYFVGVGVYRP
jgi:cytochrome c